MSIPREHRLRKHAEFELVYRNGRRHFSQLLTAFYVLRETSRETGETTAAFDKTGQSGNTTRVGITVGRALGKSTIRNRIKRRVRAAVGKNLTRITRPIDVVINPKKSALEAEFKILCSEIERAFDVIEQKAVRAAAGNGHRDSAETGKNEKESDRHRPGRLSAGKR